MVYPVLYRVSTIQGGAGFLPSTVDIVLWEKTWVPKELMNGLMFHVDVDVRRGC